MKSDDERIEKLVEMRWWDWSVDALSAAIPWLTSGDVDGLHAWWLGEKPEPCR